MRFELDLELPDVELLDVSRNGKGDYVIELHSTKKVVRCRKCGRELVSFKGYDDWIEIRHLPVFGRKVYLRIRPRRYQCSGVIMNQLQRKSFRGVFRGNPIQKVITACFAESY